MKQYYVAINEEKQGPFSISELQKIDLNKKTLVWYSGLNDWVILLKRVIFQKINLMKI